MRLTPRRRALWLGGYALASFLAFPHHVAGDAVDLGLGFAWLAPACLLVGLRGLAPGPAAQAGFAAGLAAHSAVLHWIFVVTVTYGHASIGIGLIAPVALASYIAAFTALFAGGYAWLAQRGRGGPLSAALLWTVLDHLRSFALTGFPWATLGYAQHQNGLLLWTASLTGVYGLSFATVLAGSGLAELLATRRVRWGAAAALGVVLVLHGLGPLGRPAAPADPSALRIAVLQGNIDQGVKWSEAWVDRTLEIYEGLTRQAVAEGARLVVWPETSVPGPVGVDPDLHARVSALARETQATLVVGAMGLDRVSSGWRFYDSAFVFDSQGTLRDRYDKAHLVPFGEYVPLRGLLGALISAVASGSAPQDVSAGSRPRALRIPVGEDPGVSVGIPICYELLFPDLVRRFVGDGAGVLLAITNDAWYGRTGAPHQFLAITALRSAETGVWTARAANTGVSAFIDHRGRVRQQTPIFQQGLLIADVPLHPETGSPTFYVRHGDVFAWGCWIGVVILFLAPRPRPRKAR